MIFPSVATTMSSITANLIIIKITISIQSPIRALHPSQPYHGKLYETWKNRLANASILAQNAPWKNSY